MPRLTPYLGILAALVVVALVGFFVEATPRVEAPTVASTTAVLATTTPFTLPDLLASLTGETAASTAPASTGASSSPAVSAPRSATHASSTSPTSPTTSATKKTATPRVASTSSTASVTPQATTTIAITPTPSSSGNQALDAVATTMRDVLVNILCYAPAGGTIRSISGSGIFIDSKGIILTNAHIGQYFLLADRGVSCTIRSGSPAVDAYKAALIYISPLWLRANPSVLSETAPAGTGQYDFALLGVTGSATAAALPAAFPAIRLAELPPATFTPVVIASYGAQFLQSNQIQSGLYPTIVFGSVKDVYTFGTNTVDVLSLGGSAAAQEGSSGGGTADSSGALVGTITTSTVEGSTDTRNLDAITASYIRAEYASETDGSIDTLLAESVAAAVADFAPRIPQLESIITANL